MAGVLQHLRSSTLNKRPNPASMVDGQIAINYASGSPGAFFKDTNGNLVKVGPVHVGTTAPNVSPASGGTAGNSLGEQWLDTSGGTYVFKIWDGAAWRSEAGEFVNSTGDTMTGSLTMGPSANLIFEGSVDDGFETTLTVVNPTADRTITLPNVSGTVITTGDSGTVTSTMIADGTIVNADVNASAAIAGTKISPDFGGQNIVTTGSVTGASLIPSSSTVPTNGLYLPAANTVALSTASTGRLFIDSSGNVGVGVSSPQGTLSIEGEGRVVTIGDSGIANRPIIKSRNTANDAYAYLHYDAFEHRFYDSGVLSYVNGQNTHVFHTSNSERLRITSAGLVGIGTSSPVNLLHVQGDATFDANAGGQFAIRGSTSSQNRFNFGFETTNNYAWIQAITSGTAFRPIALNPSGGNVGIGTTDPVEKLEVRDGNIGLDSAGSTVENRTTERFYKRTDNGSTNGMAAIGMNGAGTNGFLGEIKFYTGTSDVFSASLSERARIDSSGRLLVGTSSAFATGGIQVVGSYNLGTYTANAFSSTFAFIKSRSTTPGQFTIVQSGDEIGGVVFQGTDGSANITAASIYAVVDGTPGTNDMPGRLVFSTTADGASSPTERMRIKNNGTINFSNVAVYADNAAATTGGLAVGDVYRTSTGQLMIRY